MKQTNKTNSKQIYELNSKGWYFDILNCVNKIDSTTFTLEEMYTFEKELSIKHPNNHHIKDKIRQQLQLLRDNEIIEFIGKGYYRKL